MIRGICVLLWGSLLFAGSLLWPTLAAPARPDPADFAAPLQATPPLPQRESRRGRSVRDPMTGEMAFQAPNAAAAIAAATGQRAAGCRQIRFGSDGFGWVATGVAKVTATDNPVAARRLRREARFQAFMDARTRLNGGLRTLTPEAQQRITERLEQNDAIRLALINLAATDQERREQALAILARGFVAYAVDEDADGQVIRVHLVTTPQTAVQLTRPIATAMETASLREGLKQLQAEVAGGLIPLAGNRLIVVNATGELALVGYAINLIGAHPDPAAQDKLRADAEKIATVRATEALSGLAAGDDAVWQNGLDEASRDEIRTAASGYEDTEPSARRFEQIRDLMLTAIKDDAGMQALREGRLPSAAMVKRFSGEDAVAIMISYAPPVKKRPPPPPAASPVLPAPPPPASLPPPIAPAPTAPVNPPPAEPAPAPATPANPPPAEPAPANPPPANPPPAR